MHRLPSDARLTHALCLLSSIRPVPCAHPQACPPTHDWHTCKCRSHPLLDKCISHPSSNRFPSVVNRDHCRKPQRVKTQRTTDHAVPAPVDTSIAQFLHLRPGEHQRSWDRKTVRTRGPSSRQCPLLDSEAASGNSQ